MTRELLRVCNDIIKKATEENIYLPPTKLQKLLYFLYGHYLAEIKEPLFEESFQAWQYGPVIPEVYNRTRGVPDIETLMADIDGKYYITNPNSEFGKKYFEIFNYVWSKYKLLPASRLSYLTHADGSPWRITCDKIGKCQIIPVRLIEKYFSGEDIAKDD